MPFLTLIFLLGSRKRLLSFFMTAICGLEKDCFVFKTLHFKFYLDFLICTIFSEFADVRLFGVSFFFFSCFLKNKT